MEFIMCVVKLILVSVLGSFPIGIQKYGMILPKKCNENILVQMGVFCITLILAEGRTFFRALSRSRL